MTNPLRPPATTRQPRTRRPAKPWPHSDEATGVLLGIGGLATLIGGGIVLESQAEAYMKAGVRGGEATAGALAGYLLILAALLGAATLYRLGYPLTWVRDTAIFAGIAALILAVLPYSTAGRSILTVVLGVLMMAAWVAWMAACVATAAVSLPRWWEPKV